MENGENKFVPEDPREGSLLTVLISGFVAGVTATIAIFGIFKKE